MSIDAVEEPTLLLLESRKVKDLDEANRSLEGAGRILGGPRPMVWKAR